MAALTSAAAGLPAGQLPPGRLPLRVYTVLDGLADDGVVDLFEDSRGYLWIATNAGVSRFDGSRFVNFLTETGSASRIEETPDGAIWVATDTALFRLDPTAPSGPHAFERVLDHGIQAIHADPSGSLWAAQGRALFRVRRVHGEYEVIEEQIETPFADVPLQEIRTIRSDARGRLWLATHWGLVCRLPDGRQVHYEPVPGKADRAFDLAIDRAGRIWVGSERLLVLFPPDEPPAFEGEARIALVRGLWAKALTETPRPVPDGRLDLPRAPGEARSFGPEHGLAGQVHFGAVVSDREGRLWIGTNEGLNVLEDDRLRAYGPAQGVPKGVSTVLEDTEGDLWFGTRVDGLHRWRRRGFVTYGQSEGLPADWVASLIETPDGRIVVATRPRLLLTALEPASLRTTGILLPASIRSEGWGWGEIVVQDRTDNLWLGSEDGLCEFPRGALDDPRPVVARILGTRDGLGSDRVFRLFVDSRDDLWASTFSEPGRVPSTLTRIRLPDGPVRAYSATEATPTPASAIAESPDGTVWLGLYSGGLARADPARFRLYGERDGVPAVLVSSLWFESDEILWAATEGGGLLRVAIAGDTIDVRRVGREDGLSSDDVKAVVGDGKGSLWVGTTRGVDRFEPATGLVESFSIADGLPAGYILDLLIDRQGRLWVGTARGLARFEPGPARPEPGRATVLITQVEVDGAMLPVPALGSHEIAAVAVPGERSRVRIGFTALGANAPLFRYRLGGVDRAWSPPTDRHEVDLSGFLPGRLRFEVRLAGPMSPPASVTLRVPAPLWRRPWFLALSAAALVAAVWTIHRVRLRRALDLERQRTRIAMDLHDEIGSGLGSIGLMADMVGSADLGQAETKTIASQIGDVASELGASLAELVGTLHPGGASFASLAEQLAARGRRLFPGEATVFTTSFPDVWPERQLDLAVRRDVFLVGVEALHNAARHAGASSVRLSLMPEGSGWALAVEDDGRGIEQDGEESAGFGLASMRRRAERIGADLRIETVEGGGTRVLLRF